MKPFLPSPALQKCFPHEDMKKISRQENAHLPKSKKDEKIYRRPFVERISSTDHHRTRGRRVTKDNVYHFISWGLSPFRR